MIGKSSFIKDSYRNVEVHWAANWAEGEAERKG
jgi:hypothetical protein